jgi:SAM-dependent methyltransferase
VSLKTRAVANMRRSWLRSGHRVGLTRDLAPVIGGLRGIVLDVGGGREAPLDASWPAGVTRYRIDAFPHIRPDLIADAAQLPMRDGVADAVVMCELLEHLAQPRMAIDEARRVLRPGGTLCGSVPFLFPVHADPYDFHRYTDQGLRTLLAEFRDVAVTPHGNRAGAAWLLVSGNSRAMRLLNPVVRGVFRSPSREAPEGYVFVARK